VLPLGRIAADLQAWARAAGEPRAASR
jgi:hypothetical protein